jgi:outer membrane protein OmpA-like peptidoglycan-associated protein
MHACFRWRSKPLALATASIFALIAAESGVAFSESAAAPTEASIIEALKSKGASRGAPAGSAELISALKDKTSRGISISSEERGKLADAVKDMPVQDMEIQFELNSAEISPKAKPNIEALGHALQSGQLKGASFLLAGHTDATGTPTYNQTLSERRAQAVRQTLIDEYHLTSEQFIAVGYGLERLKDAKNPYAAENRRVQVVNIGE